MTQTHNVDGQEIIVNSENKICRMTIKEPFMKAGTVLNWPKKGPGLGINKAIIDFVKKSGFTLLVRVESAGRDYIIRNDQLLKDLKELNTEYKAGGKKWVHVIPWRDAVRFEIHV